MEKSKQKSLLYIGHVYQNKTKSSQFILDLLNENFNVTKFDFDPYNDTFDIFKNLSGFKFDIVVLWQIMPSIKSLKKYISFDKICFFPMYDDSGNLEEKLWQEYAKCNIINFSKTLHEECLKRGFCSYYIQYFPKPIKISNYGNEKSVFFWQRINTINPNTLYKVIGSDNIDKLYLHNAPDPCHNFIEPVEELKSKTELTEWFEKKEDLNKHIQKSAIYFAPRVMEGIGMSFLEAMAMGRCVIAVDNPTMNEYIKQGETGYLYNIDNPQKIELENIREIQENVIKYIENGYRTWEENKFEIIKWINSKSKPNLIKMWMTYKSKNFIQNLFSLKNEIKNGEKYKIIKILGIKIKLYTIWSNENG